MRQSRLLAVLLSAVVQPMLALHVCSLHHGAPSVSIARRASSMVSMGQPPPPPTVRNLELFVGSLLQAAGDATKVASEAADQLVNSGWQVGKRTDANGAGDAPAANGRSASPPTSPPQPLRLAEAPPELGLASASGSLAQVDQQASALLAPTQGSLELQQEFCSFLTPREGSSYTMTEKGEVVFASRDDLAALVAEFSYAKLRELAAAARALARYVDDLEDELEAADDAVVGLRRQVLTSLRTASPSRGVGRPRATVSVREGRSPLGPSGTAPTLNSLAATALRMLPAHAARGAAHDSALDSPARPCPACVPRPRPLAVR